MHAVVVHGMRHVNHVGGKDLLPQERLYVCGTIRILEKSVDDSVDIVATPSRFHNVFQGVASPCFLFSCQLSRTFLTQG